MEPETVNAISDRLTSLCRHERCLGRTAMVEASRHLLPQPEGWVAEKDGDLLRLYAIAGADVHSLAADCRAPADPNLDAAESEECRYVVLEPLTGGEPVASAVERTEGGAGETKTLIRWSFQLDREIAFGYKPGGDAPAHDFGRNLLAAIVAARRSTAPS